MTVEEAFEKLQKIKEAKSLLEEKEALAKGVILEHMKAKKLDKLISDNATASVVVRTSFEIIDESLVPQDIEIKKSVSASDVTKWRNAHATIATPPGLETKTGEPSLTIRFEKE